MKTSRELAELVGIVLGDGSLYHNKGKHVYQFVMTGHIRNDRRYFESFVLPILKRNFGDNFKIFEYEKRNAVRIRSQKKTTVKQISKLGIPFGNKMKNNVKIPKWVFSNDIFIKACIRGLVDTDG